MANAANKGGILANKPLHTAAFYKKKDRETKPLCLSAKAI